MTIEAPAPASGKRKKLQLPRALREDLAQLAHKHSHVFERKPELKPIGVRFFKALLQPHRRAGRPCDAAITSAGRLFRRYRRRYPGEQFSATWARIYPSVLPDLDSLPPREASRQRRNLRDAVRTRYAVRRRRAKEKQSRR